MKWTKQKTSVILCAVIVAFALFAPSVIQTQVGRDRYEEWLNPTPPVWQGQLTLWAVVGFPVGQGTLGGWVRERVREFEKDTFGVYVNVQVMQWNDAKALLEGGQKPDVIVFPTGFFDSPKDTLIPLDEPAGMKPALLESGKLGSKLYALPVMAGAYVLAVNEEKGMVAGVQPPEDIGYTPEEIVQMTKMQEGLLCVEDSTFSQPGLAFAFAIQGGEETAVQTLSKAKSAGVFYNGDGLLCLGNQNTAGAAQVNYEEGRGFSNSVWAVSGFTDMVEYVGVTDGLPDAKTQVCKQLALNLVSPEAQETVKTLGMFPAVSGEPSFEDDRRYWAAEQKFAKGMAAPPCFGYETVRARWADWLQKAAGGDADALRKLLNDMVSTCKQG